MTRYHAYVTKGWKKSGLGLVVVARHREGGTCDLAEFLVDPFCLGVRDALLQEGLTEAEVREDLDDRIPDGSREILHPACAKKLIEGAVAYATSLGFSPHRDYRKARRSLAGVDAALCPREFTYGCDGRPLYVRGEDDDEARVQRICAILEAKVGAGGFDYEDPEADEEEDLAVRDELFTFLGAEADEVPRFYFLSGLITAMLLARDHFSPGGAVSVLWPDKPRTWRSREEEQAFLDLLRNYWVQVQHRLDTAIDPDAPGDFPALDLWSGDFPDDSEGGLGLVGATIDWASGFQAGMELWPPSCAARTSDPALVPHFEVISWWAGFVDPENRARIATHAEAEPKRTLNLSVVALARAMRAPL